MTAMITSTFKAKKSLSNLIETSTVKKIELCYLNLVFFKDPQPANKSQNKALFEFLSNNVKFTHKVISSFTL